MSKKTLLEKYSENPSMRIAISSLLGAIPLAAPAGIALEVYVSTKVGQIKEKRIFDMLDFLNIELENLKESFEKSIFESEEWIDLFESALRKSIQTRDREKIKHYALILKGFVVSPESIGKLETYLNALSDLSIDELNVAKLLYDHHLVKKTSENEELLIEKYAQIERYCNNKSLDEIFVKQRIAQTGLIKEKVGTFAGYKGGVYIVTEAFEELMSHIRK